MADRRAALTSCALLLLVTTSVGSMTMQSVLTEQSLLARRTLDASSPVAPPSAHGRCLMTMATAATQGVNIISGTIFERWLSLRHIRPRRRNALFSDPVVARNQLLEPTRSTSGDFEQLHAGWSPQWLYQGHHCRLHALRGVQPRSELGSA